MSLLLASPKDVWRDVASFLDTPDLLKFLSTNKQLHVGLGHSRSFWRNLLDNDDVICESNNDGDYEEPRKEYIIRAYERHLPAVRWHKLINPPRAGGLISSREGHLACTFAANENEEERVVITGGFTDDPGVYVLRSGRWTRIPPSGPRDFVYGASLTVLDSTRAIRFGGFRSGGYSDECNDLWLLTLNTNDSGRLTCQWEIIQAQNPNNNNLPTSRAYHTATLISDRYLVVIGGMTESGSINETSVLDTHNWAWYHPLASIDGILPSCRHGHSVINDEKRNRLLLFGGGSGTDLLRTGEDNSEVWELSFGDGWTANLEGFSLQWRLVHRDINDNQDDINDEEGKLTPSEALCLGRCHCGLKVSHNTALFLLGSGNPSTNGVIAYDLSTDKFVKPHALGSLPQPRFTFACTTLSRGYILVHGGFSSQDSVTLGDSYVLDLAPFVNREFTIRPIDTQARSHRAVTEDEARNGRENAGRRRTARGMVGQMMGMGQMMIGGAFLEQMGDARALLLMRLLRDGHADMAAELLAGDDNDEGMAADLLGEDLDEEVRADDDDDGDEDMEGVD